MVEFQQECIEREETNEDVHWETAEQNDTKATPFTIPPHVRTSVFSSVNDDLDIKADSEFLDKFQEVMEVL